MMNNYSSEIKFLSTLKDSCISVVVLIFFVVIVSLNSLAASFSDTIRGSVNSSTHVQRSAHPLQGDQCPAVLEKWIDDDFRDKRSWGLSYKSEAKYTKCQCRYSIYFSYCR